MQIQLPVRPDPKLIMWLRNITSLPILKCRQAVIDAKGDKELAYKLLKERNPLPEWGKI